MNTSSQSMQYAQECQRIIDQNNADITETCRLIGNIKTPKRLHPMLHKVPDLAWDIVEDFRPEEENQHYWEVIKTTLDSFIKLEWASTTWLLMAIYGQYSDNRLVHSFSIAIKRQNGATIFESGNKALVDMARDVASSINTHQTDEWFLCNLAQALPQTHNELKLEDISIQDYSTESWDTN